MWKLNRRSEYALMALQRLAALPSGERLAVSQLAQDSDLPRDLLAKVLQDLKNAGILHAARGVAGGYELARPLAEIRFLDVIQLFEEHLGLGACVDMQGPGCVRADCCTLHEPIQRLNRWLMVQLGDLRMDAFLGPSVALPRRRLPPAAAEGPAAEEPL